MDDDLNTPRAIAALFDLAHDINRAAEEGRGVSDAQTDASTHGGRSGTDAGSADGRRGRRLSAGRRRELSATACAPTAVESWPRGSSPARPTATAPTRRGSSTPLIEARAELRKTRMFARADDIRDSLADLGYVLEDKPQGTRWRRGAL